MDVLDVNPDDESMEVLDCISSGQSIEGNRKSVTNVTLQDFRVGDQSEAYSRCLATVLYITYIFVYIICVCLYNIYLCCCSQLACLLEFRVQPITVVQAEIGHVRACLDQSESRSGKVESWDQ